MMNKIVLAQIDTIAGDILLNKSKIIDCIKKAQKENADLIVFPEFVLTGYPFGNILERNSDIFKYQSEALNEIADISNNITVVMGFAECPETSIHSTLTVIQNGKILFKISQPEVLEFNNTRFAFLFGNSYLEDSSILESILKHKPETIIHCDSSVSRSSKEYKKHSLFSCLAKKYSVNYIYINKVGYADNFVFDGISRIYDKSGELVLRAKAFEEDFVITSGLKGAINEIPSGMEKPLDIDNFAINYENDLERTYKSVIFAIKEYFKKNGFKKAVLGLSGGLDSSVCAVLLVDALGTENVFGISMPSKITSMGSKNDACILAKNLGINFLEVPLKDCINQTQSLLESAFQNIKTDRTEKSTTIENLQARLRATILWSVSNEYKQMLPIATSDKSESYIGYATVNGDMSGGFAPIADITKTKLFALARFLNKNRQQKNAIPESVLSKPPGAELKINPKTGLPVYAEEDNMPYEFLDEIIWLVENKHIGKQELISHNYLYEKSSKIDIKQKEEWINEFYWKSKCAVYKWHIMPPSVIVDVHSINSVEYHQPIISKTFV